MRTLADWKSALLISNQQSLLQQGRVFQKEKLRGTGKSPFSRSGAVSSTACDETERRPETFWEWKRSDAGVENRQGPLNGQTQFAGFKSRFVFTVKNTERGIGCCITWEQVQAGEVQLPLRLELLRWICG